jgi:hypothetical protein
MSSDCKSVLGGIKLERSSRHQCVVGKEKCRCNLRKRRVFRDCFFGVVTGSVSWKRVVQGCVLFLQRIDDRRSTLASRYLHANSVYLLRGFATFTSSSFPKTPTHTAAVWQRLRLIWDCRSLAAPAEAAVDRKTSWESCSGSPWLVSVPPETELVDERHPRSGAGGFCSAVSARAAPYHEADCTALFLGSEAALRRGHGKALQWSFTPSSDFIFVFRVCDMTCLLFADIFGCRRSGFGST